MGRKSRRSVNREPKKKGRGRKRWGRLLSFLRPIVKAIPTFGPLLEGMFSADSTFGKIQIVYEELSDMAPLVRRIKAAIKRVEGGEFAPDDVVLRLTGNDVIEAGQLIDAIKALKRK